MTVTGGAQNNVWANFFQWKTWLLFAVISSSMCHDGSGWGLLSLGAGLDNNIWGQYAPPTKSRHQVQSAEGRIMKEPSGVEYGEGYPLPSRLGGWEASWAPAGNAFSLTLKAAEPFFLHLHADAFEFVKQCFMSHWGARPKFGGIAPPAPNVEPPLIIVIFYYAGSR